MKRTLSGADSDTGAAHHREVEVYVSGCKQYPGKNASIETVTQKGQNILGSAASNDIMNEVRRKKRTLTEEAKKRKKTIRDKGGVNLFGH